MKNRMIQIKQTGKSDTLDMYIYGYVESDGQEKSERSADYFKDELAKFPNVKNINLYVNSWGGDLHEGMGIRNQLKRHPAYVTGYIDGFACSVAAFILTACDKVKMPSNTMQFIHNAWVVCAGNSKDLRKEADNLDEIMKGNRKAFLEKAGRKLTEAKLIQMLDVETWLTADDCVKLGLADEIVSAKADISEAKQTLLKSERYGGKLAAALKCPPQNDKEKTLSFVEAALNSAWDAASGRL